MEGFLRLKSFFLDQNAFDGFDIGYAYETPSEQLLSGISLKTHEIVLRIRLGEGTETTNEAESTGGPMNQ